MGKRLWRMDWAVHWLGPRDRRDPLSLRYSGLAVTTLIAVSVGMMIVPLPAFLLDLLIGLNIALAVTMLLVATYVDDSLRIATFPSLLLLTTLFRLALEISATRLILLEANAGQVIHAFGSFVVAGNLIVGIVVFLTLTVVQFIVVAKGAERVAEVGARFALDALPGRQMAIDAELRAGQIDLQEAHARRTLLARESQFFGAMDGAMKFVKGDAIAGMVILLTSIIGGLLIGVLQRGLDLGHALRLYSMLTIGEGLVAQIPALLLSTAAGILVTRVSSAEQGSHLGDEIAQQILAQPKALIGSAVLLALLALVPGLPSLPFLLLAGGLAIVVYATIRGDRRAALLAAGPGATAVHGPLLLIPMSIDLALLDVSRSLAHDVQHRLREQCLPRVGERLFDETGITLPAVRIREDSNLRPNTYTIRLHETVVATGELTGTGGAGELETVADRLLSVLRRHGHSLVGVEQTQALLDRLARSEPNLVREAVPKVVTIIRLAEILQCLAREGVSLRHLGPILEGLARRAPLRGSASDLADAVRSDLKRQLTAKVALLDGSVPVFVVEPSIEETLREAIVRRELGSVLALEPALGQDIVDAVGRAVAGADRPVIVTAADVRRHLRALIEQQHPQVAVLSYQELLPDAKLETRGRIAIEA